MTNQTPQTEPLTYERLMASIYENDRFIREKFAESDRLQKENERILNEKFAETVRFLKESSERADRRMKKLDKTLGEWANNQGAFAEDYFFNSFEDKQQNFFGEHFDEIEKNVKPVKQIGKKEFLKDEYDIVMYNDSYVAIIEVKFKAHLKDIPKVLRKAETFKILCPDYQNYKIYLGLATLAFYPELEQECIDKGIAIIKQVGETVVINDAHLKTY
jgi:hypothetical protein